MQVKHRFISTVPDDPAADAAGQVLPSHWNQDHEFFVEPFSLVGNSGSLPAAAQAISIENGLRLLSGVLGLAGAPTFVQATEPDHPGPYLWAQLLPDSDVAIFAKDEAGLFRQFNGGNKVVRIGNEVFYQDGAFSAELSNVFNGNRTVKRAGLPAVNAGGMTLGEFLNNYFFPNVATTVAFTGANPVREKGLLQSYTLTATVTPNDGIVTLRQFRIGATIVSTEPTNNMSELVSSKDTVTYTAYVEYNFIEEPTQVATATRTVTFVAPTYFGSGLAGNENEAFVEGLTKVLSTTRNQTRSFSPVNQRFYFAYPAAQGLLTSIRDPNNFEIIDTFTRFDLSFTLADGTTIEPYYLYRSNNNTTQTNFALTFA